MPEHPSWAAQKESKEKMRIHIDPTAPKENKRITFDQLSLVYCQILSFCLVEYENEKHYSAEGSRSQQYPQIIIETLKCYHYGDAPLFILWHGL